MQSAGSEDEIAGHIQDVFMCALDRLEVPSPLKCGHHFGEMHKPRLRRQGPIERSSLFTEILPSDQTPPNRPCGNVKEESDKMEEKDRFCDAFREAPDFPKSDLQQLISFEERVAVIYTLYCVYKEQCLEPLVCIHLPADLLPLLQQLLLQMRRHGIWDGLYIFQNLMRENAFVVDALRRPPGFLSLPLESSASETAALRELAFHLRTSQQVNDLVWQMSGGDSVRQDLSRVDHLERMCDDYSSLQQRWIASELGQSLDAKNLVMHMIISAPDESIKRCAVDDVQCRRGQVVGECDLTNTPSSASRHHWSSNKREQYFQEATSPNESRSLCVCCL